MSGASRKRQLHLCGKCKWHGARMGPAQWDAVGAPVGHGTVYALCVNGTMLFSGGADGKVCAWDLSAALPTLHNSVQAIGEPGCPILALTFGGARVYAAGADGRLRTLPWDEGSKHLAEVSTATEPMCKTLFALALIADVQWQRPLAVASAGSDSLVRVWHPDTLQLLRAFDCVSAAARVPGGAPVSFFCMAAMACRSSRAAVTTAAAGTNSAATSGATSAATSATAAPTSSSTLPATREPARCWSAAPTRPCAC